jgi:hypothetical protein
MLVRVAEPVAVYAVNDEFAATVALGTERLVVMVVAADAKAADANNVAQRFLIAFI